MGKLLDMAKKALIDWWSVPATIAGLCFVDRMWLPDDAPAWVSPAMFATAMISNIFGNLAGQARAREDTERLEEQATDLGEALAVERERVDRLTSDLDAERSLRSSDKSLAARKLEKVREHHKEEMEVLVERHREQEDALRLQQQATEAYLREEIEKKNRLRDADTTLSQGKIEELLRENGNLKAELAMWKSLFIAEKSAWFDMPQGQIAQRDDETTV